MFKQAQPIVLASQSQSRKQVLDFSKIIYTTPTNLHSDSDEETFKQSVKHLEVEDYIQQISNYKALDVSLKTPESFVLSGDQGCVLDGEEVQKPSSKSQAIAQLTSFSGKTLRLITSLTLCKSGRVIWQYQTTPTVTFRKFSMKEAEFYVEKEEENNSSVVGIAGACRIESPFGFHIIKQVSGDNYSIMGLPIHALIEELYKQKILT